MPKNAVQRLHKIESDIKSVLSLYEVAKKYNGENENKKKIWSSGKTETLSRKRLGNSMVFSKNLQKVDHGKTFMSEDFKTYGDCTLNLTLDVSSKGSKEYNSSKKSGSVLPSNISTTSYESNYLYRRPDSKNPKVKIEEHLLPMAKTTNDMHDHKVNHSLLNCEIFITPNKTMETSNIKNNQGNQDDNQQQSDESISQYGKEQKNDQQDTQISRLKTNSMINVEKIVDKEIESKEAIRARLVSPQKVTKMEKLPQCDQLTSKSFPITKTQLVETKKGKPTSEISYTRFTTLKKIPRPQKQRSLSLDIKNPNKKVEGNTGWFYDDKKLELQAKEKSKNQSRGEFHENCGTDAKQKISVKSLFGRKKEEDAEIIEDETLKKKAKIQKSSKIQRISSAEKHDSTKLLKEIERSNEKLEKMKGSKDLALDIAKTLKDKYEDVEQSKKKLIKTLQKVEKDNDMLDKQVKYANDSKIKLQLQMEEFQRDSKTMLLEQNAKSNELKEENDWLKTKMNELRKQYNEKLLEKERQIERIQKQRFLECRTELNRAEEDVRILTKEKIGLLETVDKLQSALNNRHFTIGILELEICELQEEVRKQKLHLKQKSDRLEDTNNELESIRQSSKYLEEQVKTLRKNIEYFDELHKKLVQKTFDYEHQIKTTQEDLLKFQNDNEKLKKELNNEKDSLLIKNKIIEDQQETIKQLREKPEEVKAIMKRNQSLERVLHIEREEKLELQDAVERLKWRKEELKEKIKSLEEDLLVAPQEVIRDLQKTQIVLHELENQVQIKQTEWELQLETLVKEKEQACSVAEFATKKLMQKTNEFQRQSEENRKLNRILAESLAETEKNLREANEKVGSKALGVKRVYK